ncbi:MAG: DNA-protecting protein DprA [Verrucomicrobia bacterium]|nr:DNA-protecting protein DprA [Verrucomicrobiota bacterium]
MNLSHRQAVMILCGLRDFGPITINRLLQRFGGDARAVLAANEAELRPYCQERQLKSLMQWDQSLRIEQAEERLVELGARFILREDPDYPPELAYLVDAPPGIYVSGGLLLRSPAVALIGTRQPTAYGIKMTRHFVAGLVKAGVQIISGLARGIDTVAHEEALRLGGETHAVLGGGLDVIYPRENRALYQTIANRGALWSEFPCGRPVDKQSFPQRNRIVAGMSQAVLVIESGEQGGSMITARFCQRAKPHGVCAAWEE